MKKRALYTFVPVFLMAILFSPLTVSPSSAIITIPPSAFQPIVNCDFRNDGAEIYPEGGNPCLDFHAPVYLPQGVTATKLIFYWRMYQLQIMEYAVYLEKTTMEVFIPVMVWVIPKVQIYLIHPLPSI